MKTFMNVMKILKTTLVVIWTLAITSALILTTIKWIVWSWQGVF